MIGKSDLKRIAMVLPKEEFYSPKKAGALSLWSKEVCSQFVDIDPVIYTRWSKHTITKNNPTPIKIHLTPFDIMGGMFFLSAKLKIMFRHNTYPAFLAVLCKIGNRKLIHIHNRPSYAYVIKRIYPEARIILHMHNDHFFSLNKSTIKKVNQSCDKIICVSDYIKKGVNLNLRKVGLGNEKTVTILNGVNLDSFKSEVDPQQKLNILFVGRLVAEKGILQLIKAFKCMDEHGLPIELKVIGGSSFGSKEETDYVQELKAVAKEDPRIKFLGPQSHKNVVESIKAASVFVVPSVWNDPCPLTVLEGMAAGKAIITSNRGGIPELIGDAGIIIDPDNIPMFAKELQNLVLNRSKIKSLGQKARKRAEENFSWQRVAQDVQEIYNNLN